jgi:hypothetical protein
VLDPWPSPYGFLIGICSRRAQIITNSRSATKLRSFI